MGAYAWREAGLGPVRDRRAGCLSRLSSTGLRSWSRCQDRLWSQNHQRLLACMLGLVLRLPHKLGGLQDLVLGPERCRGLMQELAGDCSSTMEKVPLWAPRLQRSALPGSS